MKKIFAVIAALVAVLALSSAPQVATATAYPDYRFTACNSHNDATSNDDHVCVYGVISRQADGTGIVVHSGGFYGWGPNSSGVCDDLFNGGWDDNPPIVNKDNGGYQVTTKASGQIMFTDYRDSNNMPACDRVYPNIEEKTLSAARISLNYTARLNAHQDPSNWLYVDVVYSQGSWTMGCGNLDNGSPAEQCYSPAPGA